MFTTKKLQWFCLKINPYKHLNTSDVRLDGLYHAHKFYSNFSCCINMRTKSSKTLLKKKSKLKMTSFAIDKSKSALGSKDLKDVDTHQRMGRNSTSAVTEMDSSNTGRISHNRHRTRSKESIPYELKKDSTQSVSAEVCVIRKPRSDNHLSVSMPIIQSFLASYVPLNITFSPLMLRSFNNPMCFNSYPSMQLTHNHSENFMCRSYNASTDEVNERDVEHDRRLLFEWRTWQRTASGKSFDKLQKKDGVCNLTVMTYNVLAQDLLSGHEYLYKYHKRNALTWERRWRNLLHEIKQHNADILCLQEVQSSHLEDYYSQLNDLGYKGIYKQRTGDTKSDGCAIYYKVSTVTLVNYTTVEFNQPNVFLLNRDNVAIVAKFAPIEDLENEFVVATTHLLYNPRREDVRLAQTQVLLSEIDRFAFKSITRGESIHLPIIMTGDFNFIPNSAVYQLITRGVLKYDNLASRSLLSINPNNTKENATGKLFLPASLGISDKCQHVELADQRSNNNVTEELEHVYLYNSERVANYNDSKKFNKGLFSSGILSHHLAIQSAYRHRVANDVEATTFQNKWITVDYIFYSGIRDKSGLIIEDKLKLLSRYTIPTSKQLHGINIPNYAIGSDHFSLVVKFKLDP